MGSTGSIGESTLRIVDQFPDRFRVVALAAGKKVDVLAAQAARYGVKLLCCAGEEDAVRLRAMVGAEVEVLSGQEGLLAVATFCDANIVVSALVGSVGVRSTFAALKMGRDVAVANKETLVVAGAAIMAAAKASGARLLPVDSEHSALFQVLDKRAPEDVKRVILTASGGPFRGKKAREFDRVPPATALRHPNWTMGPKITIDSATLMNKGLEVIEARWLFDMPPEKIDVTLHPQSIVHSMVEFRDGALLAQMGVPDMRGPIGYALSYPERLPMDETMALDLWALKPLTFEPPDLQSFPCLALAYEALRSGGTAPALLNGANEVAVEAYLEGRITFGDIPLLVADVLNRKASSSSMDLDEALAADGIARILAREWVGKLR